MKATTTIALDYSTWYITSRFTIYLPQTVPFKKPANANLLVRSNARAAAVLMEKSFMVGDRVR